MRSPRLIRRSATIHKVPRLHALVACALLALQGAALLHAADPHAHAGDDHACCSAACTPADTDAPEGTPGDPGHEPHDCGLCLLFDAPATPSLALTLPTAEAAALPSGTEAYGRARSHPEGAAAPRAPPHSLA